MFAGPLDKCEICSAPTAYVYDSRNKPFCEAHIRDIPEEFQNSAVKMIIDFKDRYPDPKEPA